MALEEYRVLCWVMNCSFEEKDSFVYSSDDGRKLVRELKALTRLGLSAEFSEHIMLPFSMAGAVKFERQAQLHPLKYIAVSAGNLYIFEHTKVLELAPCEAATNHMTVSAEKVVVATIFPFSIKHGGHFLKLHKHRSYVLPLKNAPDVKGMYVGERKVTVFPKL